MIKSFYTAAFGLSFGLICALSQAVAADDQAPYAPHVLAADDAKIVIEINAPMPTISRVEAVGLDDEYFLLALPGYAQTAVPGEPQLPVLGFTLAVPMDSRPHLQVLDMQIETHRLPLLLPAPAFVDEEPEPHTFSRPERLSHRRGPVYRQSRFMPAEHLQLGNTAVFRGQRLLPVRFLPVAYNPATGQAAVCRSIRFAVSFASGTAKFTASAADGDDELLRGLVLNPETLGQGGAAKPSTAPEDDYFLNRSDHWYKVVIEKEGICRLETADLRHAGIDVRTYDPRRIGIFHRGVEIPLRLIGGEDGIWQEGDAVEFYAQSYKDYYNSTNVYWLTPDGGGKRMMPTDGTPNTGSPQETGYAHERQEIDRIYRADFPGHTDNARWFMDQLNAPKTIAYTFQAHQAVGDAQRMSKFKFRVQAYANMLNVDPDHHTQIVLNGHKIYDAFWDGRIALTDSVLFLSTLIKEGENLVQFIGPGDTGSFLDWILIDWFEVEYWRKNQAVDEQIAFRTDGETIRIFGFKTPPTIYDVTDPYQVRYIVNADLQGDGAVFSLDAPDIRALIAVGNAALKPETIYRSSSSILRRLRQQCDYLFITKEEFMDAVQPLADWHRRRGLDVEIIDVQQIYDEFSYGFKSERAIRAFLAASFRQRLSPAPRYVLLIGDASWNPRRLNPSDPAYGGDAETDIVPTRLFESSVDHLEACSDNWFACVDGEDDLLPDLFVGRLPARTPAEARQMVDKILAYHGEAAEHPAMGRAVFVAGLQEKDGDPNFEAESEKMISRFVPPHLAVQRIFVEQTGGDAARNLIKDAFSEGALLVNFFGHGAVGIWTKLQILTSSMVGTFGRTAFPPFVFTMSCINGLFTDPRPENTSLAEALLNQDGRGAVAVFSGSGKAFPTPLYVVADGLYTAFFQKGLTQIGTFCTAGLFNLRATYPAFDDHLLFYILFGDPACPLRYDSDQFETHAGFAGQVRMGGGIPMRGKKLQARIAGETLAQTDLKTDNGIFGPLYLPADDPMTPAKEGGAMGDTVTFYLLTENNWQLLHPAAPWLPGQLQNLNLSNFPTSVQQAPEIEFFVND